MNEAARRKKIREARDILRALGLPRNQQNEISALTLLALAGVGPADSWSAADDKSLSITKGIMKFVSAEYRKNYAPNTRETFRRQVLHQFVQAGLCNYNPDDPDLPVNSPRAHYALTKAALSAIRAWRSSGWNAEVERFRSQSGVLLDVYGAARGRRSPRVRLADGRLVRLSPGRHNQLQASIVEDFAPRFAPEASLVYMGDAENKDLFIDRRLLQELGVKLGEHGKLPDVILFEPKRRWLFLIEAVTSHGPMSPKRVFELKELFGHCDAGIVFVTAFPDFGEFRRHIRDIAWETEVWLADVPDHLIHYNGERFFGPR